MTGLTVLVVEDSLSNLRLVADLLSLTGHHAVTATSVAEAGAWLDANDPDLVLTDIKIPGGGGREVLEQIRGNPRTVAVPVVAVTAFAMRGDRERLLAMGFDGYISKPIDTRTFVASVVAYAPRPPSALGGGAS